MAKRITQSTFDAVVEENKNEFGMSEEEAVADAVSQFESQGVDLSGIIKSVAGDEGRLPEFHRLATLLQGNCSTKDIDEALESVANKLLDKDVRAFAGKQNALPLLLQTAQHLVSVNDVELVTKAISVAAQLLDGQPDLLCPPPGQLTEDIIIVDMPANEATKVLFGIITHFPEDANVIGAGLNAVSRACIKHEMNRQALVDLGIVHTILQTLRQHSSHVKAVVAASECLRALTLDDDVRVPFGKAHTNVRTIIAENHGLDLLVGCLKSLADDQDAISPLAITIARLAVRSEYCQQIVDLGGASTAMTAMQTHTKSTSVQMSCCCLIRAVAGNDNVKAQLAQAGCIETIIGAMQSHIKSANVIEQGCAAIAALCLRNGPNSSIVIANGGPSIISNGMYIHGANVRVQKNACHALRNVVARIPESRDSETRIRAAMAAHPSCTDAAKGALRDLGCHVELRELWTGTAGLGPETLPEAFAPEDDDILQ